MNINSLCYLSFKHIETLCTLQLRAFDDSRFYCDKYFDTVQIYNMYILKLLNENGTMNNKLQIFRNWYLTPKPCCIHFTLQMKYIDYNTKINIENCMRLFKKSCSWIKSQKAEIYCHVLFTCVAVCTLQSTIEHWFLYCLFYRIRL